MKPPGGPALIRASMLAWRKNQKFLSERLLPRALLSARQAAAASSTTLNSGSGPPHMDNAIVLAMSATMNALAKRETRIPTVVLSHHHSLTISQLPAHIMMSERGSVERCRRLQTRLPGTTPSSPAAGLEQGSRRLR